MRVRVLSRHQQTPSLLLSWEIHVNARTKVTLLFATLLTMFAFTTPANATLASPACWSGGCVRETTDCATNNALLGSNTAAIHLYPDQGCTGTPFGASIAAGQQSLGVPNLAKYGAIYNDSLDSLTWGGLIDSITLYKDINYTGCSLTLNVHHDGYQSGWEVAHTSLGILTWYGDWNGYVAPGTSACLGQSPWNGVSSFIIRYPH